MKLITRTVMTYKHTFVAIVGEQTLKEEVILPYKLGQRTARKFLDEKNMSDYCLVKVEQVQKQYSMSLEDFLKYATIVD